MSTRYSPPVERQDGPEPAVIVYDNPQEPRQPALLVRRDADGFLHAAGFLNAAHPLPQPRAAVSAYLAKFPYGWHPVQAAANYYQAAASPNTRVNLREKQALANLMHHEIVAGLAELVEDAVAQLAPHATIADYNRANALRDVRHILLHNGNPGVAAWPYLMPPAPAAQLERWRHPGQPVAAAKAAFHAAGGIHWKTFAAANPDRLLRWSRLTDNSFAHVVALSDLSHRLGQAIPDNIAGAVARLIAQPPGPAAARDNYRKAAFAYAKQCLTATADAIADCNHQLTTTVADYLHSLNETAAPLTAATWNGMVKAAQRWHQNDRYRAAADAVLQHAYYPSWNCLLPETELNDGLVATPLPDARALVAQGQELQVCVGSHIYTDRCRRGDTRIYALSRPGGELRNGLTVELKLQNGSRWQAVQVAGTRNRPPDPAERRAADALAMRHTELWRQTPPDQRHQPGWTANTASTPQN